MSPSSSNESFYLISYDIANDKRRNKIAKILVKNGNRVQYSVFEVIVNKKRIDKVIAKMKKVIDFKEDSIRIYKLCSICAKGIEIIGQGEVTKDEDFYII